MKKRENKRKRLTSSKLETMRTKKSSNNNYDPIGHIKGSIRTKIPIHGYFSLRKVQQPQSKSCNSEGNPTGRLRIV